LNNLLRRHFIELTDRFLSPLNRYFESLLVGSPVSMTLSTLKNKPEVKPFKQESFLKLIQDKGKINEYIYIYSYVSFLNCFIN